MSTISERLKSLIEVKTTATRRHKEMEEATKLPAEIWKAWWHGKQRPNEEMIQAIAQIWPEYAFWLSTGITDAEHGHHSPLTFEVIDDLVPLDIKKLELRYKTKKRLRTAARDYFLTNIAIERLPRWTDAEIDEAEMHARQTELLHLLSQRDVEREIRKQQEATLSRLEEEAFEKWDEEYKSFLATPKDRAKEILASEEKNDTGEYTPPRPDDIAF